MQHVTKDIAELCAAAGLDTEAYQVFPTPPLPATDEEQSATGDMRSGAPEPIPQFHAPRGTAAAEAAPQWQQLNHAFGAMHAALSTAIETERVIVASVAGGTGASTVVATLSRILSASQRISVIDATEHQLLTYHLGIPHTNAGGCTIAPGRPNMRGAAHIFGMPLAAAAARFDWAAEKVAACEGAYHRVIVDAGSASGVEALADSGSLVLLLAVPDTNAAVRLPNLISILAERCARVALLLNKFDDHQRLHLAFCARLQERFADALLPFRIRFSPLVPEALAEGQTVVDFAAGSPVAEDFARLAAWLDARRQDCVAPGGSS